MPPPFNSMSAARCDVYDLRTYLYHALMYATTVTQILLPVSTLSFLAAFLSAVCIADIISLEPVGSKRPSRAASLAAWLAMSRRRERTFPGEDAICHGQHSRSTASDHPSPLGKYSAPSVSDLREMLLDNTGCFATQLVALTTGLFT